jgi:thiol-disulfide isomerase/thioredoxin
MILTFVLASVLAQSVAAPPPELTGVLDSELTAGTPWANVSCNEARTVDRSVLPQDLARERYVWSCTMLSMAPIGQRHALFIERRGREPVLLLDENNDGRFDARERHEFLQNGDLQVRIPIAGARFPEYPITVRYRWEFFEPPADPSHRVLLESAIAYVAGTVTVGGRPVRVEYPVLTDMMPTITGGWFRIDANGDGRIDDDLLSEENTPPSTRVPIARVGTRYVSTISIDTDTGIVKLKEHPPADYQRIVLRVGDQLPDFTYQDLTTRPPRALSDIHARLVLLVVWSSWCPPALDELPWIEEASRTLGGEGLAVLGLPDDEMRGDVESVISRFRLTWPNADPESIRTLQKDRWQTAAVPQFIVLDGDRRIVGISHTFDSSLRGARLSKTLQQWLRESR